MFYKFSQIEMFLGLHYAKIIKPTQLSGFIFGGVGGNRTRVQTRNKNAFYKFSRL